MAVYAAGMTVPLAVLAALCDRFDLWHRKWLRGVIRSGPLRTHTTSLISGALFVGIGLLTAGTANLGGFLSANARTPKSRFKMGRTRHWNHQQFGRRTGGDPRGDRPSHTQNPSNQRPDQTCGRADTPRATVTAVT